MKKAFTILVSIIIYVSVCAQPPQKVSYQAIIRASDNNLVINTTVGMQVSILQGSVTGTPVYVETHTPTTNENGLITIEIGAGSKVTGIFADIDWATGPYFINTEVDPLGGTAYSITGTSELTSVPYALYAENSSTGFSHYIGELYGGGIIFYLYKIGRVEHGLIASLTDLSTSQVWSNIETIMVGAGAQSSWDGLSNSNAIIAQAGHTNSAALVCRTYNAGGFNDWYLPSVDELSLLYSQVFIINKTLPNGGLNNKNYWSSSESIHICNCVAIYRGFGVFSQNQGSNRKNELNCVRAVRAF